MRGSDDQSQLRHTAASINPSGQTAKGYSLTATATTGNTCTFVKAATGVVTRSCTRPTTQGGCPTCLTW